MENKMEQGDLVHIPQGVEMWNETEKGMKMQITRKPITGVYLSTTNQYIYRVYADGNWDVKITHVYPLKEQSHVS